MSLSFLSKKSWHTTNLKNVERVWLAEKKAEEEDKKVKELQKQIVEERQIQELRRLQAAQGQNVKQVDTSLDWMYEGPSSSSQQTKESEEYLLGKVFRLDSGSKQQDSSAVRGVGSTSASANSSDNWEKRISSQNDTFTRIHEDPLLVIRENEKKARERILSNPLKLSKLKSDLERQISQDSARSTEKDSSHHHRHHREHRDKRPSDRPSHSKSQLHETSSNSSQPSRQDSKYGLAYSKSDGKSESKGYLGPNPDLIAKKDKELKEQLNSTKRKRETTRLSEDERQKRLAQMEMDAHKHESQRASRVRSETREPDKASGKNPTFLKDMRASVYLGGGDLSERIKQNSFFNQGKSDI